MFIQVIPNRGSPPAILLRESYREGGKVKKRTLCNLTRWPPSLLEGFKALLKGGTVISAPAAPEVFTVDSSGRRNTAYVSCSEELVQSLGRCSPAQGLSRPAVEGDRHGCKVLGAVHAEVGA